MERERLLLIDSCISNKVATSLRNRGRATLSLSQLRVGNLKDPPLLEWIHKGYPDCVLVTSDDHMPEDHAAEVALYRPTLAIVDPWVGKHYNQFTEEDPWKWEVCMRWAHRMQAQEPQSIKRYNDGGGKPWKKPRTPRTGPKRRKAEPPTGLAAAEPIVPRQEEAHEQPEFDFEEE